MILFSSQDLGRDHMKANRDEIRAREAWIQERLGERKYRQLRMHLSGALRLLGELAPDPEIPSASTPLKPETAEAVAALTERLRELSPRANAVSMHASSRSKARRKTR
jgi:hypothetical protein